MSLPSLALSRSRPLRYAVFFYLYVMVWLPGGFSGTALYNYLTAGGATTADTGDFVALAGLPWAFQFVWGPVIDRFQRSAMGRRRPWVLGAQLLALAAFLGLLFVSDPRAEVGLLGLLFFVHGVCAAVQDTAVDALAISVVPDDERGRVTGFMRAGGLFGGLAVGAAGGAVLLEYVGFRPAVLTLAGVLLALTLLTLFVKERPGDALFPWSRPAEDRQAAPPPELSVPAIFARSFGGLVAPRSLVVFGGAAVAYLAANVSYRSYSNHLLRSAGWGHDDLSVLTGLLGAVVPMAVVLAGGALVDRVGHRRMLVSVMVLIGVFLTGFNLLAAEWGREGVGTGALVAWSVFDPLVSVTAMPLLMAICRRGVEGSQFTAYMALVNLTDVAGQFVTGRALEVVSPPAVGLCCGAAVLVMAAVVAAVRPPEAPAPLPPADEGWYARAAGAVTSPSR
ncbi:MAG: MFS transporter [Gemmataceae bacterium]|nr:MFS transporter [Gemmataceae bacterium]